MLRQNLVRTDLSEDRLQGHERINTGKVMRGPRAAAEWHETLLRFLFIPLTIGPPVRGVHSRPTIYGYVIAASATRHSIGQ